jgi:cell division septation protein DedD
MRDVERLREKIEISLDDRQVWALGLSALLLLGGVFTVGVLVGRKTAPPQQSTVGDLAALDAAAAVGSGRVLAGPRAADSAGPQAADLAGPQAADSAGPQASHLRPQASDLRPQTPIDDKAKPAEKAADDEAEAPAKSPAEKSAAEKAAEKRDSTMGRAPAHAATVVVAPRPVTVVPAPPRPVQVASATPAALTPPPRDLGKFTVQIGASQDRAEAQRMENRARAAGLKPYAVEADLGAKGTWYRVRVGVFHDKDAANSYRRDVERELRSPAVVMSSK